MIIESESSYFLVGWIKKLKIPSQLRNQTEIEPKNKLIEPIGSVLVFILYNSRFQFRFKFTKYKNCSFG